MELAEFTNGNQPMPHTPAGGSSTINGVLYQLLYALLSLGGFRVTDKTMEGDEWTSVTLIAEPSKGGDQQAIYVDCRRSKRQV